MEYEKGRITSKAAQSQAAEITVTYLIEFLPS